ncbi:hypothetical protein BLS_005964 [Venturia inaequalis]|uniref:DNA repair protein Dds20/Mei5 n=1 Tax=Venturia inaequalis TaxID=5025 RepID=A0A8H3YS85_VENIN|nr:hypothetical protein BLS_005964 [Venturia inaequalis]
MDTPAKRRRLNASVNKPFKSPMRTPFKPNANPPSASPLGTAPVKLVNDSPTQNSLHSPLLPRKLPLTPSKRPIPASTYIKPTPPTSESLLLSRQNRTLETSILRQKQDLDTLKQALAILSSPKSLELEDLAEKWRTASRLAAEEVFAGARDKVNKMGGVGAWRERENERANFGKQWDEPPPTNDDDDTDDDDEETSEEEEEDEEDERVDKADKPIKLSKKEMKQLEREARVAREEVWGYDDDTAKVKKAKEEEALMRDDDGFTMDMMLKTMNIDLELIGYDKRRQQWVG